MLTHALPAQPILEFASDVRAGLTKPQKELLSKYLYDDVGSALFEVISVLPEYGLTRADERVLQRTSILLERYARRRTEPVLAMHAVTDGLARLFGDAAPWLRSARNLGMAGLDRPPAAKRLLAQAALR